MATTSQQEDVPLHRILWTGGWDSTFLVLDAVIVKGHRVQPIYIVDPHRSSTDAELGAMRRIREAVADRFGSTVADRIGELQVFAREDVPEHADIAAAYKRIRKTKSLGTQYQWVANFARWQGIDDAEMAVHDKANDPNATIRSLEPIIGDQEGALRVLPEHRETDFGLLFRDFTFPIGRLLKPELAGPAREHGFHDIMEMSHFCHRPFANCAPCGRCAPCDNAIATEMGHRIGFRGWVVYILRRARVYSASRRIRRMLLRR